MQEAETGLLGKDRERSEMAITNTLTYEVFGGEIRTYILCLNCHKKSLIKERYYDLSIVRIEVF
jgi:hypothetical protein